MISKKVRSRRIVSSALAAALTAGLFNGIAAPATHAAGASHIVISQIYGGGGNSGAKYKNDFIELYNPTDMAVDMSGWSVQYASSSGTSWTSTPIAGQIASHGYYLIQEAAGSGGTDNLPTPDSSGNAAMAAGAGKVALVSSSTALTVADPRANSSIIDFVGFGSTTVYEGTNPTPAPSATLAVVRKSDGIGSGQDTDDNAADFTAVTPNPRNSASPVEQPSDNSQSLAPIGQNMQLTAGTLTGFASSAAAGADVKAYDADPATVGSSMIGQAAAGNDGSFTIENLSDLSSVYVTVTETDKSESSAVRIDEATAASQVTSLAYYGDSAGKGRLTGTASPGVTVSAYADADMSSAAIKTVTSAADGSFVFSLDSAPDQVYVSQAQNTDHGRSLPSTPVLAAKQTLAGTLSIAAARAVDAAGAPLYSGLTVTVEGVVTVDNNVLGSGNTNLFIQDETGGIDLYAGTKHNLTLVKGNKIQVTGTLSNYNGLIELAPASITPVSDSEDLPASIPTSISGLNVYSAAEPLEGSVATLQAKITSVTASGTTAYNVTATDPSDSSKSITVRVINATGIAAADELVVGKTYTLTGIVEQYDNSSPYTSGYQLFLRSPSDIVLALSISHTPLTEAYVNADVQIAAAASAATSVKLYYRKDAADDYTTVEMASTDSSNYTGVIPAADLEGQSGFEYYLEATDGNKFVYSGSAEEPHAVTLADDHTGPTFTRVQPGDGETVESYTPDISALVQDLSGIKSITLTVDGADVTSSATLTPITGAVPETWLQYVPPAALAKGPHTAVITAMDSKDNASSQTLNFTVTEPFTGGNHYRGTTHDHTMYSHDASGTPAAAIASAKTYGFDWIAITDHSHDIDASLRGQAGDSVDHGGQPERVGGPQWQEIKKEVADGTEDGTFVALPSFEMTSTIWGHSNVFGTTNFIDREQNSKYYNTDYNKYYDWLDTYDTDVFAVFNHPDWPNTPYGNFAPYDAEADKHFSMIEVGNGSGHYSYSNTDYKYYRALDMGWHVAPVYGEDNHDQTWGQTMKRTVVVAKELTQEALMDSMKNMHVYMSEDPNFQLDVFGNGAYMGATVGGSSIQFNITGEDPVQEDSTMPEYAYLPATYAANDNIAKVEIISNGGKAIQTYVPQGNETNFTWQPKISVGSQSWYVVKVTQKDGDRVYSAPIWSQAVPVDAKITSVSLSSGAIVAGTDTTVQAEIGNAGLQDLTDVRISLYEDTVDEAHLIGEPTTFASIPSGATKSVQTTWTAQTPGDHSIIAVLDPIANDSQADNTYTLPVTVKAPLGITVLVDAAHKNENTSADTGTYKNNLKVVTQELADEGYTVRENHDPLSASTLNGVKVLVLTHPYVDLTAAENAAVAAFVQSGGSLLLTDKSNYNTDTTVNNDLLEEIGSGIRINNDGIFDDTPEGNFWSNQSSNFAVRLHTQPNDSLITDKISRLDYYSGSSLVGPDGKAITDDPNVQVLAWGNASTYQDSAANASRIYHLKPDAATNGSTIPAIAVEQVGDGRVFVSGTDLFNDMEMDDPEANDNAAMALNVVDWLADRGAQVKSIADVRKLPEGTPVVAEGTVTSAAGTFFDAFYMQDATGGIMVYKEVPDGSLKLGDTVRVYGHVSNFENNTELEFDAFDVDVIKTGHTTPVVPQHITTGQATDESYQGLLVDVKGTVKSKYDANSYVINDGSGDALVFTDGYIVNQGTAVPQLQVGDTYEAIGLVGKFSDGKRIRVRDTSELIGTPANSDVPPPSSNPSGNTNSNPTQGDSEGVTKVTADQLKGNGSSQAVITVPAQSNEVLLPANAGQLLSTASLVVQKDNIGLEVPAALLNQLADKVSSEQLSGSSISLKVNPMGDAEAKQLLAQSQSKSGTAVKLSGLIYQIDLSIVTADGQAVAMKQLDHPITLRLKVAAGVDPGLAGIYYVADDGKLQYIGGKLENGELVAQLPHLSSYAVLEVTKPFTDLPKSHWAYDVIEKLAAQQIINGTSPTTFEPARQITRAEFATLLVKALKLTGDTQAAGFQDIAADAWYAQSVALAYGAGIVKGKSAAMFDPNGAITREEMAVMLMNAYHTMGGDMADASEADAFPDAASVASWANESVAGAAALHLVKGRDNGVFDPKGRTTRAEAAQAIVNLLNAQ